MNLRSVLSSAAAICGLAALVGAQTPTTPADAPFSKSGLTRQQVLEKLTSTEPGTKVVADQGKKIFDSLCASCHKFGTTGAEIGPDLTGLAGRFNKKSALEAIMWPSRAIADEYVVTTVELRNGTFQSGVVLKQDRLNLHLKNQVDPAKPIQVRLADIKNKTTLTTSLMPEGLMDPYTLDEIDSLAAYLLGS